MSVELLGAGQGVVRGRGSVGLGEGCSTSGGVDAVMERVKNISMMCWNVAGWFKGVIGSVRSVDENDFRAKVIYRSLQSRYCLYSGDLA